MHARRRPVLVSDVGHELEVPAASLTGHDDRLSDALDGLERRFDLAQLHPEAPDLDLEVAAAEELDVAVRQVARQVAGLVQRAAGSEGVGDEPLRGQFGSVQVAAPDLDASDVQLTGGTHRNRLHVLIEDVDLRVGDRLADGHERQLASRVAGPGRHVDRGLGRAVQVVQLGVEPLEESILERPRQRFTAADDPLQARAVAGPRVLEEELQHRRHEVDRRDLVAR